MALAALVAFVAAAILLKVGLAPFVATAHGVQVVWTDLIESMTARPAPPSPVVPTEPAPPPAAFDALAVMPAESRAALVSPEPSAPQTFRAQPLMSPVEICAAADAAGLSNPGWRRIAPGAFECMSNLVPVPGTRMVAPAPVPVPDDPAWADWEPPEPRGSSLFFVARGAEDGQISTIRFKLNLEDPSVDKAGRAMLLARLDDVAASLAWSVPDALRYAVDKHARLAAEDRGISFQVHPEDGAVRRINVVLTLSAPPDALPLGRFEPR